MRIEDRRPIEGSTDAVVTKVTRTWEGTEITFGGVYVLTMGRQEWYALRDRINAVVDSTALL